MIISSRQSVRHELSSWFGDLFEQVEIAATFNLVLNAANMVKSGIGAATCLDLGYSYDALTFVPFSPNLESGTVLAWKKDQTYSPAAEQFLRFIKAAV